MDLQEKINQIRIQSLYLSPTTVGDCMRIGTSLMQQKAELLEKYQQDLDYLKSKIEALNAEHDVMLQAFNIVEKRLIDDTYTINLMYTK